MANKKKIEERLKAQKVEQTTRTIQWVGGGVLLAVVIGLIWLLVPGKSSNVVELPTEVPPVEQVPLDAPDGASATEPVFKQYDAGRTKPARLD